MGENRFVKRDGILKGQVKECEKPEQKIPIKSQEKPEPEHIQKRPSVLIIESFSQVLLLIDDILKAKCDTTAYKVSSGIENALDLAKQKTDFVIIGPMFQGSSEKLASMIREMHSGIKIIKLAGTAEYKKITSEFPIISSTPTFDEILQFSRLSELQIVINQLFVPGGSPLP